MQTLISEQPAQSGGSLKRASEPFGVTPGGQPVQLFSLANDNGMEVQLTNYGGIITSLRVPDREGRVEDVVLGHETLEGYLHHSRYFGALIGRYANRIARGKFVLNGREYVLATNHGKNHLHGGLKGFDKVVWQPEEIPGGVRLIYRSPDGEEGYPGNLEATVDYTLGQAKELRIDYFATTDKETIVNLTNHSYFNLAGAGTVLDHELEIRAESFTPVDEGLIPTGEIRAVTDTPMDFTRPQTIGARIKDDYDQLRLAGGYDHNFVLQSGAERFRVVATLYDPKSGRIMQVSTTQPGLQFYSGNFLDGSILGKGGRPYVKHCACCFETQHFPDSPNQPSFPSTVLRPGERYQQTTVFRFSTT